MKKRAIFLILSSFILVNCKSDKFGLVENSEIKCPSGIGAQEGDKPKIDSKTKHGNLVVCGFLEKALSDTSFEMSEFDVYHFQNGKSSPLFQLGAIDERVVRVEHDGSLKFTQIEGEAPLFERTLSCTQQGCSFSTKKCVLKLQLDRYRKPITLVTNKKWLLEDDEGQGRLFMAALHGYGPAQEAFEGQGKANLDGALSLSFKIRKKIIEEAKSLCKYP